MSQAGWLKQRHLLSCSSVVWEVQDQGTTMVGMWKGSSLWF